MSLRVQKLHVSALLHQPVIEASVLVRDECGVVEGGAAEVLAAGQRLGADYGQEELRDILSVETHGLVKCCQAALVFRVERFPANLSGLLLQQVYITRDTCAVNIADVILQQGSENSACHTGRCPHQMLGHGLQQLGHLGAGGALGEQQPAAALPHALLETAQVPGYEIVHRLIFYTNNATIISATTLRPTWSGSSCGCWTL